MNDFERIMDFNSSPSQTGRNPKVALIDNYRSAQVVNSAKTISVEEPPLQAHNSTFNSQLSNSQSLCDAQSQNQVQQEFLDKWATPYTSRGDGLGSI
jgi:hypothetical protein